MAERVKVLSKADHEELHMALKLHADTVSSNNSEIAIIVNKLSDPDIANAVAEGGASSDAIKENLETIKKGLEHLNTINEKFYTFVDTKASAIDDVAADTTGIGSAKDKAAQASAMKVER